MTLLASILTSHTMHKALQGVFRQRLSLLQPCRCLSSAAAKPIRALIIGSPGSGKGTLSSRLLRVAPSLKYLSAGDVLRQEIKEGTDVGQQADEIIRKGKLMPDAIMMKIISAKVQDMGPQTSWLLDGFPRTKGQAAMFDDALRERKQTLDLVLHLDVPFDVVMSRILDRFIHEPSGRTYNTRFNPPKTEGRDDVTGDALTKRSDDDADTFEARLESFQVSTQPLIDYYAKQEGYLHLTGTSSDEIWPNLLKAVKERFGDAISGH